MMKTAAFIVLSFFFLKGCGQDTKINTDEIQIEYSFLSRGFFKLVRVDHNTIKQTEDRDLKSFKSKKCSKEDWETIVSLLEKINVKNISELKAPTEKRLFDGAPHAELKIIIKDTSFTSSSFDHGEPPEEIKSLVNSILSLARANSHF